MSPQKGRPLVDPASFELAVHFLGEIPGATEDDIWALARDLQTASEDACREVEERQAPSSTPADEGDPS
jgi:hypothetical protein